MVWMGAAYILVAGVLAVSGTRNCHLLVMAAIMLVTTGQWFAGGEDAAIAVGFYVSFCIYTGHQIWKPMKPKLSIAR
jgi:hypothetical protein